MLPPFPPAFPPRPSRHAKPEGAAAAADGVAEAWGHMMMREWYSAKEIEPDEGLPWDKQVGRAALHGARCEAAAVAGVGELAA